MGWFTKRAETPVGKPTGAAAPPPVGKTSAKTGAIDWSTAPIPPSKWAQHALPYPDSVEVVDQAVRASGITPSEIDRVEAVVGVWKLIVGVGKNLLETDPQAVRGLEAVWSRPDLSDELLWNYFTHQDARGIAARNHLIESVFGSGQAVEVLVQIMRDGGYRSSIAGSDRVG